MACTKFTYDTYALHVLGLADEPERTDLIWHLKTNCEDCTRSVTDALEFWFLYASLPRTPGDLDLLIPSPELRSRILNSIRPPNLGKRYLPAWTRERVAAGIIALAGTGTLTWELARFSMQSRLADSEQRVIEGKSLADSLSKQIRDLQSNQAAPAAPAPAAAPPPAIIPPAPGPAAEVADLQRQLNAAGAAAVAAQQALAAEQTRIADLQRTIADQTAQLTAAVQTRDQAQNQLRDAQQQIAQGNNRVAQREAELQAAQNRVRDLEVQIVQYRLTLQQQQQSLNQHLQIAALLKSPTVRVVQLRATEAGPGANGVALIGNNSTLVFYASNLPALPNRRVYQLWLMRGRAPAIASAGIFSTTAGDLPTIQFQNAQLLAGVTGLAVTDEPPGGSPLPTGHKLLVGTPR